MIWFRKVIKLIVCDHCHISLRVDQALYGSSYSLKPLDNLTYYFFVLIWYFIRFIENSQQVVSKPPLLLDYWDLKLLFDMYYVWIFLVIWILILYWGETILIIKIVKPLNLCVVAIKFFSSLELIKGLCIWFTGLYNFFCLSRLLTYYSIWDKVLHIWCWHLVRGTIS